MQGFANYHDEHRPVVKDEQLEAIETYTKIITFLEKYVIKCTVCHMSVCVCREGTVT